MTADKHNASHKQEMIKVQWIPIDQQHVRFLGTECAAEVYEWKDGKRADSQSIDVGEGSGNTGLPLWTVDVLVIGGGDRAEVAGFIVPARERPVFQVNQAVEFERPQVKARASFKGKGEYQSAALAYSYRAAGIKNATPQRQGEKAA